MCANISRAKGPVEGDNLMLPDRLVKAAAARAPDPGNGQCVAPRFAFNRRIDRASRRDLNAH